MRRPRLAENVSQSLCHAAASLRFAGAPTEVRSMMQLHWPELIGVAAAAASLYAFYCRTIIPLRIAAIVANVLAMLYSFLHGTYPTFALNAVLLPLNAWRLHAMVAL